MYDFALVRLRLNHQVHQLRLAGKYWAKNTPTDGLGTDNIKAVEHIGGDERSKLYIQNQFSSLSNKAQIGFILQNFMHFFHYQRYRAVSNFPLSE